MLSYKTETSSRCQLLTVTAVGPIQACHQRFEMTPKEIPRNFSGSGTKSPSLCEIDPELQKEVLISRFGF